MIHFDIDRQRIGKDIKVLITYYIDKISSPCLLCLIAAKLLQYLYSASVIHDGVETTSGVSSSAYALTTVVTNFHAPELTAGSLTRWTEDGRSSLVGSVANSTRDCMSYSGLPALHDLSSALYLWVSSLGLHLLPTCPLWMHAIHLLGIVTSFILYTT